MSAKEIVSVGWFCGGGASGRGSRVNAGNMWEGEQRGSGFGSWHTQHVYLYLNQYAAEVHAVVVSIMLL